MVTKSAQRAILALFLLQAGTGIPANGDPTGKKVRQLLKKAVPGETITLDLVGNPACNLSELRYLGETKPGEKGSLKVIRSFIVTGRSCRGTSRILLFDAHNRQLGNYYMGMPSNLPDSLSGGLLHFPPTCPDADSPSTIDLTRGIPEEITLPCEGGFQFERE